MTDKLKSFLNSHRDLIETEDYDSLYKCFRKECSTHRALTAELTELLMSCGAGADIQLEEVPPHFIATVKSVDSLRITRKTKKIETSSFNCCPSIKSIIFETSFDKLPPSCFNDNPELTTVIGLHPSFIGDHCFSNCEKLSEVDPLDDVKYFGPSAFSNTALEEITLGENSCVCQQVFRNCKKLQSATIGSYLIRECAFDNCLNLEHVVLTNPTTNLMDGVFAGCSKLTSVIFTGTKEQFKKMPLSYGWRGSAPIKVVHCSDGDVTYRK